MNVLFDARWCGPHGIGRFAVEVLSRLPGVQRVEGRITPASPWDVFYSSWRVARTCPAFWFSPGYNAPLFGLHRYVVTIHDLNHLDLMGNSGILKRLYYQVVLKRACRNAARVLTVSEFSRHRIIEWAGINGDRIVNVGNGTSEVFSPEGRAWSPGYRYFLCVGNRKPHKNEARVLQAFAQAAIPADIRLVFSGPSSAVLVERAEELGVDAQVEFLGRLEESALAEVYRGALALLFPSLYEGFGLPVVESMACGTPVLTSNVTALTEVAGDAALMVDPLDVQAISAGIERLVGDVALRYRLRAKGLERATLFSWDDVANRVQDVLAEVVTRQERKSDD